MTSTDPGASWLAVPCRIKVGISFPSRCTWAMQARTAGLCRSTRWSNRSPARTATSHRWLMASSTAAVKHRSTSSKVPGA